MLFMRLSKDVFCFVCGCKSMPPCYNFQQSQNRAELFLIRQEKEEPMNNRKIQWVVSVQTNVDQLVREIEEAVARADAFIASLQAE